MAEAVVSLALDGIGRLLNGKETISKDVKGIVEDLLQELRDIRRYLKGAEAKQYEDEQIRDWVAEVREAAYDAEDVISNFVLKGLSVERDCSKASGQSCIEPEIDAIKSKIARLIKSVKSYGFTATTEKGCSSSAPDRMTFDFDFEPDDFVGFETDGRTLVEKLVSKDKCYSVISICGMGGLGKTTLAQKLYQEEEVKGHFKARAWVSISQQWNRKDVLQRILTCLIPEESEAIVKMIEYQLVQRLNETMHEKNCLVVLDDIWSQRAWDEFLPAFRCAISSSNSKILLTSRNKDVAKYANKLGYIHDLECLTKDEGLELLLRKAILPTADFKIDPSNKKLWMERVDPSKKELGTKMVEKCGRLPLAIVVLGGLLATKYSLIEWEEVYRNVGSYLEGLKDCVGEYRRVSKVLDLSYRELPYELKACFLYLASFPENFDIEAERLYYMWMAEGLVSRKDDSHETTMEIAEQKLGELAQRCMVQVKLDSEEKSLIKGGRRFKSLRLHDFMRDFCLSKAKEENFLTVINYGLKDEQVQHPSSISSTGASSGGGRKIHRVAIHFPNEDSVRNLRLLQREVNLRYIRTLLFFYNGVTVKGQFNSICKDSRLLRALDFITTENSALIGIEIDAGDLVLLRHLGLKGTGFRELPSSIEKLTYLQTLDLRTEFRIVVPNVLCKMEGLIHLYLPYYQNFSTIDGCVLRVDGLSNLETLENFAPDKVDFNGLFKLTNLQELKTICISKKLDLLREVNHYLLDSGHPQLQQASIEILKCDFRSEEELSILRQLLTCDCLVELKIDGTIARLPEYNPPLYQSLTSLTLFGSELKKDPMATLEKLPMLRRLNLLNRAFVGKEMFCSSHGFPNLNYLHLSDLPNLEEWRVDNPMPNAMPNLSTMVIDGCPKLKMLPDGLRLRFNHRELQTGRMDFRFYGRVSKGEKDVHGVPEINSIRVRHFGYQMGSFFKHTSS